MNSHISLSEQKKPSKVKANSAPRFFSTPAIFRTWLKNNHKNANELIVGFHKKHTAKPSITWPESVAEALCFGWIDGIRRSLDAESYTVRFTPRRRNSQWSAVNIRLVAELEAKGKMTDAGRAVFMARPNPESNGYTHTKRGGALSRAFLTRFRKNKMAWAFFEKQPPGYRKSAAWWVMIAKQVATRERRLAKLMDSCLAGKRLMA